MLLNVFSYFRHEIETIPTLLFLNDVQASSSLASDNSLVLVLLAITLWMQKCPIRSSVILFLSKFCFGHQSRRKIPTTQRHENQIHPFLSLSLSLPHQWRSTQTLTPETSLSEMPCFLLPPPNPTFSIPSGYSPNCKKPWSLPKSHHSSPPIHIPSPTPFLSRISPRTTATSNHPSKAEQPRPHATNASDSHSTSPPSCS